MEYYQKGGRYIDKTIGQIIKGVGGVYDVKLVDSGDVISCNGRGKVHRDDKLYIGDMVAVTIYKNGNGAIDEILPRKNRLVRPYISNIDAIIITIAEVPKADFLLVDKILINCLSEDIEPIICVNKLDIATSEFLKKVHNDYDGLATIVEVSALSGAGIEELMSIIKGEFVCLSGQSAVGKSSIINKIIGRQMLEVGELSKKIERGKHCTRQIEIFEIGDGIKVADTCGFSVLELPNMNPAELASYFVDFDDAASKCRFKGCCHINEPSCEVRARVKSGEISSERYNRYLALYKDCDKQWRERYDRYKE